MVLGAITNPTRYSYLAIERLLHYGHPVVAIGRTVTQVFGMDILVGQPKEIDIHTITIYLNKTNQKQYYNYILNVIKPVRIIFNPGAENEGLRIEAEIRGIETLNACTLVMLSTNQY